MKWLLDFLKGKWRGHPLHPIVVHVPMAMWPGALIFDLLSQWNIAGNAMVRLLFTQSFSDWAPHSWQYRPVWSIGPESRKKNRRGKLACII